MPLWTSPSLSRQRRRRLKWNSKYFVPSSLITISSEIIPPCNYTWINIFTILRLTFTAGEFRAFLKSFAARNQSSSKIVIKELIKRSIKFHNDQRTRSTLYCDAAEYFSFIVESLINLFHPQPRPNSCHFLLCLSYLS